MKHNYKDDRGSGFLSDFGIMPPLVPVVKILKKNWGHLKNMGESKGRTESKIQIGLRNHWMMRLLKYF